LKLNTEKILFMISKSLLANKIKSNAGFTLIELIVSIAISMIIISVILSSVTKAIKEAKEDREKISTTNALSGVLQAIGNDIKAAGESVDDDIFPVITFNNTAKSSSVKTLDLWNGERKTIELIETNRIIIRRAILKPLTLCQQINNNDIIGNGTLNYSQNGIIVATDDTTIDHPGCRPTPLQSDSTITPVFPQALRNIRDYRCKFAITLNPNTLDGCHTEDSGNNSYPIASALMSNKAGKYNTFAIYDEQLKSITQGKEYKIFASTAGSPEGKKAIADYPIGSSIYIIEKREYAIDNMGNINLYVNDLRIRSVASNIEKFQVSARLYSNRFTKAIDPTPSNSCPNQIKNTCIFNSSAGNKWKDIASIRIEIKQKYQSVGNNITPTDSEIEGLTASNEFSFNNNQN
jgi:type II secretory pathway pseudopilin PulG